MNTVIAGEEGGVEYIYKKNNTEISILSNDLWSIIYAEILRDGIGYRFELQFDISRTNNKIYLRSTSDKNMVVADGKHRGVIETTLRYQLGKNRHAPSAESMKDMIPILVDGILMLAGLI